jgi:Tfp pilus assembly protein FimT
MNTKTPNNELGSSVLQLLIVVAIVIIVSGFALMGITSARAHIRRSNSARLFASYVERARGDSVRRHAQGTQQASIQQINTTTYSVTMDFSGSGTVTTQNFATESGVTINIPLGTVTFDWRGRTAVETSVRFANELPGSTTVHITGSGDVTIDSEIFEDGSLPAVILNGLGGNVISDPTPTPDASASPSPSPSASATPTPDPSASATPTPDPSASATPSPYPSATPVPSATVSPSPSPSATATPVACSITTSVTSITIAENGSGSVSAHLNNFSGTGTITATSSNAGQIQVSPGSATVSGSSSASFTITVKKSNGSVTFSSSCGSQTVDVVIQ